MISNRNIMSQTLRQFDRRGEGIRSVKSPISWSGAPMALASAALFGASTPLAKLLLGGGADPWLLAGLLYLGSGLGLGMTYIARGLFGMPAAEAPLRRADLTWLALAVLSGGVIGPLLLMLGLARTPASSATLLLNVEGLITMGIAWVVFKENVDRRLLFGALAILGGAVLLSWQGGPTGVGLGALAVIGACAAWGIDNNLTRKLSSADPVQITAIKGVVAGTVNLALALGHGASLPALGSVAAAGMVGLFGYGVSLVLFVLALRHLGTARTGAYFSTAPFLGTILALILFHEPLTWRLVTAAALMAIGLYLHLAEQHEHHHAHEAMEHEHRHVHDAHHQHEHGPADPRGEPHTHWHRHAPMLHRHPHYPDLHHRHGHATVSAENRVLKFKRLTESPASDADQTVQN
jgi:drug/metabolite transporter (DMT)-like permease